MGTIAFCRLFFLSGFALLSLSFSFARKQPLRLNRRIVKSFDLNYKDNLSVRVSLPSVSHKVLRLGEDFIVNIS